MADNAMCIFKGRRMLPRLSREDNLSPKARMKYVKSSSQDVTSLPQAGMSARVSAAVEPLIGTNASAAGTNSIRVRGRAGALEL
ncbi:MAG TPA: hypothetical protein VNZ53_03990 [Steroidobacteraceae bacterium]|nr:hypothetical protein [Steroidobacteraceae bacterium]